MSKKTKPARRVSKFHIFLIVVSVILAVLFSASLMYTFGNESGNIVKSETLYLLIALAVLLPILLFIIAMVMFAKKKPKQTEEANRPEPTPVQVEVVQKPAEPEVRREEPKEEPREEGESDLRFPKLCKIDEHRGDFAKEQGYYDEEITLKDFCRLLRDFAAGEMGLYYDIKDIRQFVAGMAVSKIIILQGMSGTGKTSLARAFGKFIDNTSAIIAVQPMWKERTDLIGYFNEFTKKFSEQDLLVAMYEASYSEDMYITVLDEMNIARVEYYFAEYLSLLEVTTPEERELNIVAEKWPDDPEKIDGKGKMMIPVNMWYIGTANNDDSTFAISDKVYDRAMIMDLDKKAEPFRPEEVRHVHLRSARFYQLAEEAQKEYHITARNKKRLAELDKYMIEKFHVTFGNRIMMQIEKYIPVYVSCGGSEIDALDEILSKKVMRKLSMQNPILVRNASAEFIGYLEELFGEGNMQMCKDSIMRIASNA